jgi:hypothetical protein
MRLRDKITCFGCIVLAVGLLIGAGMQLDYINSQRQEMKLISNEPLENAPPSLAFATIALGAFRGLIVDILWMRADKLKEEGQFFDARQLAEWITILQPRFASVWEFHAWNMAYNISVAIPATQPDQRWLWVKNGYELLRDKAIDKYKLKNITLYRELGRIFQHKIGGVSDDAHKYYKLQLALAMAPLLGPADNQYFDALAEAPVGWREITKDPNTTLLIKQLKSADKAFSDNDEFMSNYLSLRENSSRFEPAAGKAIDDFRGTEALEKFDIFAKAWQLRNEWKLDPVLMRQLNRTYGPIDFTDPNTHFPLDWRHPNSHAIYWAVKGLQIAAEEENRKVEIDEVNTNRIVFHSLQDLFRNGKIFIYELSYQATSTDSSQQPQTRIYKEVFLRPDLRMFDSYNKSMLAMLEKYKGDEKHTRYESVQNGHRNMLKNAVLSFYQSGHKLQAQKIYDQLKKLYDLPDFEVPLVEFARKRLLEELDSIGINDAKEQIIALLRETYYLYAIRDDDVAASREKMAIEVRNYYMAKHDDPEYRIDLPDIKLLRYSAMLDFLNDQLYPPYLRQSLLSRIRIEKPELFKQLEAEEEKLRKQSE